jgi:hypothetical protein
VRIRTGRITLLICLVSFGLVAPGIFPVAAVAQTATGGRAASSSPHRLAGIMPMRGANSKPAISATQSGASYLLNIPYLGGAVIQCSVRRAGNRTGRCVFSGRG